MLKVLEAFGNKAYHIARPRHAHCKLINNWPDNHNLLKNSHSSCKKKGAAKSGSPTQDGQGEKVVKSRWQPRNGCDSWSMAKIFNNNSSGQFVSLSQLH